MHCLPHCSVRPSNKKVKQIWNYEQNAAHVARVGEPNLATAGDSAPCMMVDVGGVEKGQVRHGQLFSWFGQMAF